MSKRFGRQQKRKLNATIAELETRLADVKKQYRGLAERAARNVQIVEDTARLFGEHFITLDPDDMELDTLRELGDEYRTAVRDLPSFGRITCPVTSDYAERTLLAIQSLPVLKCESYVNQLRHVIHYRFTFNGTVAGYAVSQEAISQQPGFKEQIRKNMSEVISQMFMEAEASK
jgi:hypothetical protein